MTQTLTEMIVEAVQPYEKQIQEEPEAWFRLVIEFTKSIKGDESKNE